LYCFQKHLSTIGLEKEGFLARKNPFCKNNLAWNGTRKNYYFLHLQVFSLI